MIWALLVIDLQHDLCWAPRRAVQVRDTLPAIHTLIRLFGERNLPVVYTRFELPPDDPQFKRFGDVYCVVGTPGAELIDEIQPLRGPVVRKTKHSAFFDTDLDDILRASHVEGLVLTGLQTQICVLTTAIDAHHRGYSVVVASDAVVSTHDDVRLQAVDWIRKYVGDAQPVAEIAKWL